MKSNRHNHRPFVSLLTVIVLFTTALNAQTDDLVVRRFSNGAPLTVSIDLVASNVDAGTSEIRFTATGCVDGKKVGLDLKIHLNNVRDDKSEHKAIPFKFGVTLLRLDESSDNLDAILRETFGLTEKDTLFKSYQGSTVATPAEWSKSGGQLLLSDPRLGNGQYWNVMVTYDVPASRINIRITLD